MVEQHYRWDFVGLSTDTKPTPETSEKVVDGSTFYCSDTSKLYVFCKDTWYERKPLGGGGGGGGDYQEKFATILTDADYDADNHIDAFTLDGGYYVLKAGTTLYLNSENEFTFDVDYLFWKINNAIDDPSAIDYDITLYGGTLCTSYVVSGDVGEDPQVDLTNNYESETFTFTLVDGTTITKNLVIV